MIIKSKNGLPQAKTNLEIKPIQQEIKNKAMLNLYYCMEANAGE